MQRMTEWQAAEIKEVMAHIVVFARDALQRVGRIGSAEQMSRDDYLALAKEVEQVGELVQQLERANRHIVPALFEVPHGNWQGWSGLENYRNRLVHDFRELAPDDLFKRVTGKLALDDVARLLDSVESVALTTESFAFGSPERVAALPLTTEFEALHPGHSIILFRFNDDGEAMVVRSWRDTEDQWRASTRWLRTLDEDDKRITHGIRDTEMLLLPTPVAEIDSQSGNADTCSEYSLNRRPSQPFAWMPRILGQADSELPRSKKSD